MSRDGSGGGDGGGSDGGVGGPAGQGAADSGGTEGGVAAPSAPVCRGGGPPTGVERSGTGGPSVGANRSGVADTLGGSAGEAAHAGQDKGEDAAPVGIARLKGNVYARSQNTKEKRL
jgi:hypothetical protein